ncbi:MAG: molybdenum hydroxylase [Candidatus Thermofonsia Clade 1 bacterium]|uniref:Molybdenum hydroxylase n=1 Tax=Candidatus Thermofonsia Clade 1 bacterium TaxID=2364210 RepID=A0A2M8PY26_9CHLR|nr:MAG: molybdenum hydroxylase [Candidatus Thermofonsia Clade 1 bacterium]
MRANPLILLRGGGDLASGVAYRLRKVGLPVVITELAKPLAVRTTVSYGMAAVYGAVIIEGIVARRATLANLPELYAMLDAGIIPVLIDPEGASIAALEPAVVIDGRVAKTRLDTHIDQAPLVIALGPGFVAGEDCHAVIETNRGHHLGRVYWRGSAEPDSGLPANLNGRQAERVLRAPCDGLVTQVAVIGCVLREGQVIARVGETPVHAPFDGVLRGLIDDDTPVVKGMKIGDLDPRVRREHCFTISDKSLAVGGGALEAVLAVPLIRAILNVRQSWSAEHKRA